MLGVYDVDLIYSWTPRQFKNFVKGAQLKSIDEWELAAASAMFNAKASNSKKRIKPKDIYDAEKIRKSIDNNQKSGKPTELNLERYHKARQAMKNYSPGIGR